MARPILVTGAAGGSQGATGRRVTALLLERGLRVRALVHRLDARSDGLRALGAEVIQGDLLDPDAVRAAMRGVGRAYFTYPVTAGLLEAAAIFASAAREVGTERVVSLSQLQNTPDVPSFRNLQHRLADRVLDWARVGAVHLRAPPFYENVRSLTARSVAEQDAVVLPWGSGEAILPLVGAEDVARVAAALLAARERPRAGAYELVGETPTVSELVATLGAALGRPIRYVPITDEQWAAAMRERLDPHALDHLAHLWRFFRTADVGRGERGFHVGDAIRSLTGSPPLSLRRYFEKNREAWGVGPGRGGAGRPLEA